MPVNRIVIIGLDGVPYRLLKDLAESGVMPNTRSIIENGVFRQMESTIPEISSVAWSSIITGKNPAEHGIFGFTDFPEGTYRLSFPNFNNLKALPFWKKDNSGRSVIINVPSTFPASEMNGVHISGFVALDLERSTYPSSLVPRLKELNYQVDVDSSKAHQSLELFLTDLDRTLKARKAVYQYLWKKADWQTFMLVFTGTDRLMHFLWNAYEDSLHKYHAKFLDHFRQIDEIIGEISNNIKDDDSLIMLSDHGFESLDKNVNINYLLQQIGFLKLKQGSNKNFSDIDFGTKAFALNPARIYINLKDKYPCGSVYTEEVDEVSKQLFDAFDELEVEDRKVIKKVYYKNEVFKGPFINQAPDLVLVGEKGFNLKANIKAESLYEKNIFTGKHTQHDAFLLVKDFSNAGIMPDNPSVFDVLSVMKSFKS